MNLDEKVKSRIRAILTESELDNVINNANPKLSAALDRSVERVLSDAGFRAWMDKQVLAAVRSYFADGDFTDWLPTETLDRIARQHVLSRLGVKK